MRETATLETTLARAVLVLDASDDLDVMSEIGAAADVVYDALRELNVANAALALGSDRFLQARDVLRSTQDRAGRLSWLLGRGELEADQARLLADLSPEQVRRLMSNHAQLVSMKSVLLGVGLEAREELVALLNDHDAEHGSVQVPDTVPAGW